VPEKMTAKNIITEELIINTVKFIVCPFVSVLSLAALDKIPNS
jgi:hypothetical protein